MIVYPGVTETNIDAFNARLAMIPSFVDGVHIDFSDGVYVKEKLVPLDVIELPQQFFCEAHLMVVDPVSLLESCVQKGFKRVLVHYETVSGGSVDACLGMQERVHELGMEFGVVFCPGVDMLNDDRMGLFDQVVVMPIVPGFSGRPFLPNELDKVRQLRARAENVKIEVDGHVNDKTAQEIVAAGATVLVSTSFLDADHFEEGYSFLKQL